MKHTILSLLMMLLPLVANADHTGSCGNNVTWEYESDSKTLYISGSGEMNDYGGSSEMAFGINDRPWENIINNIIVVKVLDGVTSIGNGSFYGCENLTTIELANSITSIGSEAFYNCNSLVSITLPENLQLIGNRSFYGCTELTSITIPNLVKKLGVGVFQNCKHITSVTMGNRISSIKSYTFDGCSRLNSITLSNEIISIGDYAFSYCYRLASIKFGEFLENISASAFAGCYSLSDVYCYADIVPNIFYGEFPNSSNMNLYVLSDYMSNYKVNSGWKSFKNIYSIEKYSLKYYVDNKEYQSYDLHAGMETIIIDSPVKEHFSFSGWSDIPSIMPNHDVVINGYFIANKYKLIYEVDGAPYKIYEIEHGTPIIPESYPTKEFYTFSGWSQIPEQMPGNDVVVVGSFIPNIEEGWNDVTQSYIINPSFNEKNTNGWTIISPGGTIGPTNAGCMRFFDTSLTLTQKLCNLPKGKYRLSVQGFYRCNDNSFQQHINGTENISAFLFAGNKSTKLVSIYSASVGLHGSYPVNNWCEHEGYPFPDNATCANYAFESGLYSGNIIEFETEGDINIGILCQDREPQNYCVFDNFKLEYFGDIVKDKNIITYMLNDSVYKVVSYFAGESITPEPAPTKEGYSFSGWSPMPEIMPAEDLTVTGSFTKEQYNLTYLVDGEKYKTISYEYDAKIIPEQEPARTGHTFSGWSEIPATMPANDVTVTGTFTINKYKLTYKVDGKEYKAVEVEYGKTITPEAEPTKDGYTFSGWVGLPNTMPAKDVTVAGTFSKEEFNLIYLVDGDVYKTMAYSLGDAITPEAALKKEGYTFSGWSEIPATMPAEEVTVTGTFTINKYKLTYKVDGEEFKTVEVEYGKAITPETEPTKDGYVFSGWVGLPATMPAKDVTVAGTFSKGAFKLVYLVDGEVYKTMAYSLGDAITPETAPSKEGYTFSGWSSIPETMPANDVTVTGTFTKNAPTTYMLTYKVDGADYKILEVEVGAAITPEPEPTKDGYTFSGWSWIPKKMPDEDVTITGTFTPSTGVETAVGSGRPFDVYTVTGRKVRSQVTSLKGLKKGVYIVEGKKVVVK